LLLRAAAIIWLVTKHEFLWREAAAETRLDWTRTAVPLGFFRQSASWKMVVPTRSAGG